MAIAQMENFLIYFLWSAPTVIPFLLPFIFVVVWRNRIGNRVLFLAISLAAALCLVYLWAFARGLLASVLSASQLPGPAWTVLDILGAAVPLWLVMRKLRRTESLEETTG